MIESCRLSEGAVRNEALHFLEGVAYDRVNQSYGETYELFSFSIASEVLRMGERLRLQFRPQRLRMSDGAAQRLLWGRQRDGRQRLL